MPSLLSQADDSSWMYMTCNLCNGRFQNEKDLPFHMGSVHEYGESCKMYPCDSCGFRTGDLRKLNKHIEEHREILYGKGRNKI